MLAFGERRWDQGFEQEIISGGRSMIYKRRYFQKNGRETHDSKRREK
jgi:hypothetical protein